MWMPLSAFHLRATFNLSSIADNLSCFSLFLIACSQFVCCWFMNPTEFEILQTLNHWLNSGYQAHLFTVLETWGAAPRPVGALLAIRADGILVGSVSGGCVEEDLRSRVLAGEFEQPSTLQYGVQKADAERFGLPCGGMLHVLQEPVWKAAHWLPALLALQARRLIGRQLDVHSGAVEWFVAEQESPLHWDGQRVRQVYGPAWQLLLIGAGQMAHYLAQFALALNYRVIICDPRAHYAQSWALAACQVDTQMPDDAVNTYVQDYRSAVMTLSHDPKLDDMALMVALESPAFYVGALGSRHSSAQRRVRLAELGLSPSAIARLHAPLGFSVGSRTPPEIAIAALAELIAVKNRLAQV